MENITTSASSVSSDAALLADLLDDLGETVGLSDPLSDAVDDGIATTAATEAATLDSDFSTESEAKPAAKTKGKKSKKAAVVKTDSEAEEKPTADEKPVEEKKPRITSITHKPGDRLLALIGGDKSFLTFSLSEDEATQAAKADKFIEDMNARDVIADKVRDKAVMLLTWLKAGKPMSELNEVLARSFKVLFRDNELTGGKGGNLQTDLLNKPYSSGTAASQQNQVFMLFPILGITVKEKGKMVVNEDSVIVALVKDLV